MFSAGIGVEIRGLAKERNEERFVIVKKQKVSARVNQGRGKNGLVMEGRTLLWSVFHHDFVSANGRTLMDERFSRPQVAFALSYHSFGIRNATNIYVERNTCSVRKVPNKDFPSMYLHIHTYIHTYENE